MIVGFIQVVASSDVPLDQLFSAERSDPGCITDEHRKLMDDLNISPVKFASALRFVAEFFCILNNRNLFCFYFYMNRIKL